MKKSHLMGFITSLIIFISAGIYFNGTWNRVNLDSQTNQNNNNVTFPNIADNHSAEGDNTIDVDLHGNGYQNNLHGNCEQIDDENHEHDETSSVPLESEETEQVVLGTRFGYQLRGEDKSVINWYLKTNKGRLLKRKIPVNRKKLKQMRRIITNAVDKRFGKKDMYIDYPTVDEMGNKSSVRLKREDLITSLTLLEKMWESHGGDKYGTFKDKNGRKEKVFSPNFKKQKFRDKSVQFDSQESYNETIDSVPGDNGFTFLNRIDDFFIKKANASDSFGIPFTIFDHTWGNKSLIGFNGSLRGTFGAWGNVDDGGTMVNGLSLNFSAYIFGKRKNFMSGSGHFQWDCPVEGSTSFARRMLIRKFNDKIYEKGGTEWLGRCEIIYDGSGNNFAESNGKKVEFDGLDACMKWKVFPGLKVRGCTGVKGSSGLNSFFKGGGSHSQGYIGSQQSLPYYGKAELSLSPLGFDLASLSLNAKGKLINLDNRLNVDLILQAGVSADAQRAKLMVFREILSGRIYLRLRWWSILDWDYKTWTKEIKPDGSLENYSKTLNLI